MEFPKHVRNSLSIGETINLEKLGIKCSSAPTSAMTTTRSQSYLRIYTPAAKTRDTNAKRETPKSMNYLTHYRRSSMPEFLVIDTVKIKPKKPKILIERNLAAAKRNLLQTKSDILDVKRDAATYEYELIEKINLGTALTRMNILSANFPTAVTTLQKFYKKSEIHFDRFQKDLEKIKNLEMEISTNFSKPYIRETIEVRNSIDYRKMYLKNQSCACISGIHCVVQTLCNSLFSNVIAVALLPGGQILSANVDNKVFVSTYGNLRSTFNSKVIPKLYFTLSRNELNLHWDENYGITFYTIILNLKGQSFPQSMLKLSEFSGRNITITYGLSSIIIPLSYLKVKSLEKKNFSKIKAILSKHILYDESSEELCWNSKFSSIFEAKEKDSKYMNIDYIYEALGIRMFQFFSSFLMYGESVRIETWTYKDHYLLKIYKDSVLIKEAESGSPDFKFLTKLQDVDLVTNPRTFSLSLELITFLKKIDIK